MTDFYLNRSPLANSNQIMQNNTTATTKKKRSSPKRLVRCTKSPDASFLKDSFTVNLKKSDKHISLKSKVSKAAKQRKRILSNDSCNLNDEVSNQKINIIGSLFVSKRTTEDELTLGKAIENKTYELYKSAVRSPGRIFEPLNSSRNGLNKELISSISIVN